MGFLGADTDAIRAFEARIRAGAENAEQVIHEAVTCLEATQ